MTLRRLFVLTALVLGLIGLGAAGALVAITHAMLADSAQAESAAEGVRAAAEIEAALLLHHTESRLQELTDEPGHAKAVADAAVRIRHWLGEARRHVNSPAEQAILATLTRDIERYLAASREASSGSDGRDRAIAGLITTAVATSEKLGEINIQDASRSVAESRRLHQVANAVAVSLAMSILAGVGLVIAGMQRWVYRPLAAIRAGIGRFRDAGVEARIAEAGPAELRDIAARFNEMASALARERENRLGFLAGVAHDLRNPLNALKISAHRWRADGRPPSGERALEMLAMITRQVDRLNRMVEDLLDTARIEAGKLDLRLEETDARDVVKESVELYRPISIGHEVSLSVPATRVPVLCDAYRIAQVLNNLLSNAIKYSPQGGTVAVRVVLEAGTAVVSVSDQGVGILPDDLARIFDPFQRGSAVDVPGVGLGLSVARRIAQAHGGTLGVESRDGAGTTFELRLPTLIRA
jgi:signal transduction histidine kinase